MTIKKFNAVFKSKKITHPEGDVQREYIVVSSTKTNAAKLAWQKLEADEPDTVEFYKQPKLTVIEEAKTGNNAELINDNEPMPVAEDVQDSVIEPEPETEPEPEKEPVTEPEEVPEPEEEPEPEYHFDNGHYDMPSHVYHNANGISSSMVKKGCESMMMFEKTYITKEIIREESDALRFGSLFHTLTLEPHKFEEEFIVLDDSIDRRTKAGREAYSIVMETAAAKHLMVVTQSQVDHAKEMARAAVNDKFANKLLRSPVRRTEVSFFATHKDTGLTVKVRPDLMVGNVCIDLKSVGFNGPVDSTWVLERLRREVLKYKYHLSAAMYCEVAGLHDFVWIFVNKTPGYHWVAVVKVSQEMLFDGSELYHSTMLRIKESMDTNIWLPPTSIQPTVSHGKIILPEI